MSFKVAARTILELGKELISSDSIALYELIKNSIDAGSDTGVEIDFVVTLRRDRYESLVRKVQRTKSSGVDDLRSCLIDALEMDASQDYLDEIKNRLAEVDSKDQLREVIEYAYESLSYIEIRDTGCGMSLSDLQDVFLTIGTPNRAYEIRSAIERGDVSDPPALGEKGIGRLSAMRLGELLTVRTTTRKGQYINELKIDWRDFECKFDAMIDDIEIEPKRSTKKANSSTHGTTLTIGRLSTNWSKKRIEEIATKQLARITDPFAANNRRFGIYLTYNDKRVSFTRFVQKMVLKEAHAILNGKCYFDSSGMPTLQLKICAPLYNRGQEKQEYKLTELTQIAAEYLGDVSLHTLSSLGPFQFDLYWFNRRRVVKPEGFETRTQFLDLVKHWAGIMLYRDGYQVLPYGDEDTDWLELDRKALSSGGYKLNKAQFVGRVCISRLTNPSLVDQTNREGLRDCEEKKALLHIVRFAIQGRLKGTLDDCERADRADKPDSDNPILRKQEVAELTKRAKSKIRRVRPAHSEDRILLKEVIELFSNLEARYSAAEARLSEAREERERLIDLAGIGLIIEMLAHELTRTIEHSTELLSRHPKNNLSPDTTEFFRTLRASMDSIERRLRVIDPLSVSARQQRRNLDLRKIVESVVDSHKAQFGRHDIQAKILPQRYETVSVFAFEGRIIQILENLISNSVYWIGAQRQIQPSSLGEITIELKTGPPPSVRFTDTGPGIPVDRTESVFKPFFSTKAEKTRQGLGLYIARECAIFHGGTLTIDESDLQESGTLRTFVLEFPKFKHTV